MVLSIKNNNLKNKIESQIYSKVVSIVTVTYNSSSQISNLLDSLLLDYEAILEVIILENNSPDKLLTKKRIYEYKSILTKSHIKLMYQDNIKNYGFAKACNKGAELAKGEYILFLNPDTIINKESISILLKDMNRYNAQIAGGKMLHQSDSVTVHNSVVRMPNLLVGLFEFTNIGKLLSIKRGHDYFYYEDINIRKLTNDIYVDAISGGYMLVEKIAFNKLSGFDEQFFMYLEDVDFCNRAKANLMKTLYCPHSVIQHIGGASSQNKYRIRHQAWFDSRKLYFKKHFRLANLLIQPIYSVEEKLLKLLRDL